MNMLDGTVWLGAEEFSITQSQDYWSLFFVTRKRAEERNDQIIAELEAQGYEVKPPVY